MAVVPPTAGLPSPTTKAILECEQLCLSRKGIRKLAGFEPFVQLRFLYVDHNELTELTGLEANIRIVSLFAAHNKIGTLVGSSVTRFQFLESLDLSFNELSGLDRCLDELAECRFLRRLWLHHCPVAEEADYRLRVIARLPSLELLDNVLVSPEERAAASKLAGAHAHAGALATTAGSPARTAHAATQRLLAGHTLRSTASPHSPALSSPMAFGTTDVRSRTATWLPALGAHESPPKYAAVEGWPHTPARTPVGTDLSRTVSAIRAKRLAEELEALALAAGADDARTSLHAMASTYDGDMCALGALASTLRSSPGRSLVERVAPSAQAAAADPGPPAVALRGATMTLRGNASDCGRMASARAAPVSPRSPTALLPAHTPLRATTAPSGSRKLASSSPLSPLAAAIGSFRTTAAPARNSGMSSPLVTTTNATATAEVDSGCGLGHWDAYRVKSALVAAAASTSGTLTADAAAAAVASCMEFGLIPVPPLAFEVVVDVTTSSPRSPATPTSSSARAAAIRGYVDHVFNAMASGKGKAPITVGAEDFFHAINTGEYVIAAKAAAPEAVAVVASPVAATPAAGGKGPAVATPAKPVATTGAAAASPTAPAAVAASPATARHEVLRVPILQWRCMSAADAAEYASVHAATAASRWSSAWAAATAADSPLKRPLGSKAPKAADTAIPREQAAPIFDAALAATRLASVADVLVKGDAAARTAGLTPPPPVRPKRSEYYQLSSYPPAGGVPPPTHPPSWRPSPVKQPVRPEVLLIGGMS